MATSRSGLLCAAFDRGNNNCVQKVRDFFRFQKEHTAVENHGKLLFITYSVPTPVHTVSKDGGGGGGGGRRNSACGSFGVAQQMAPHTYRNPPRKHFPPDRQGTPRTDNRPVVSRVPL